MSKYLLPAVGILILLSLLVFAPYSKTDNQEYTFTYTETQTVADVSVATKTKTCVIFDANELTLDKALERFIEQYAVKDTLDVENSCVKDRHGDYIHLKTPLSPNITITLKSDSEI